jgi:hypothetical protein
MLEPWQNRERIEECNEWNRKTMKRRRRRRRMEAMAKRNRKGSLRVEKTVTSLVRNYVYVYLRNVKPI